MGPVDIRIGGHSRLVMLGILACIAVPVPALLFEMAGLPRFLPWVYGLPPLPRFAILLPLWGLTMVVLAGVASGLLLFAERLLTMCAAGAGFIALAVERALSGVLMAFVSVIQVAVVLVFVPFFLLGEWVWDVIYARYALLTVWAEERRELRRIYREQYAKQFPTFRAFLRFYRENAASGGGTKGGSGPRQEGNSGPTAEDKFKAACEYMGLPADGSFTHAELKGRFRTLMKTAHPDAGGSLAEAVALNAAYDFILKRKGWA